MPIYAYRCEACGFTKDVLQKVSDPLLTVCLSCGEPAFKKQVTAAGFQLKGTGWYATDFRHGAGTTAPPVAGAKDDAKGDGDTASSSDKPASGDTTAAPAAKPAASTVPATPATPATGTSTNGSSSV